MRPQRIAILVVWTAAFAVICDAAGQSPEPIADPGRRIEIPGLSVLPPQGGDWFLVPVSPQEKIPANSVIRFMRRFDALPMRLENERAVIARVSVTDSGETKSGTPTEFLQAFTGGSLNTIISQRTGPGQGLIELDAVLDESIGATCVRYRGLAEITGQLPAFPDFVGIISARGLYCVHPEWPQFRIDVTYQQLYAKGQEPLALETDAASFFKTLAFNATRPVGVAPTNILDVIRVEMQSGLDAFDREQWADAEAAFQTALTTARALGESPVLAGPLYYLAALADKNGRSNAESLYQEALQLYEKHPEIQEDKLFGATLNGLGNIYANQRQFDRAEPLLLQGLAAREKARGANDHETLLSLYDLANMYEAWERWAEMETFNRRALLVLDRPIEPAHEPIDELIRDELIRDTTLGLALACLFQGKIADGLSFSTRFLSAAETAYYPGFPDDVKRLAALLHRLGRDADAKELEQRAAQQRSAPDKKPL